jgi:hypothetical protein
MDYTFTILSDVKITNLNPSTYRAEENPQADNIMYVDRDYQFTSIWSGINLDQAVLILTANNDKGSTGSSFLTFDVNRDVTVYVAVAGGSSLTWMQGWENTTGTLNGTGTGNTFVIYKKDFAKGQVVLGGNEGSGSNMYSVFVTPYDGPTIQADRFFLPVMEEDLFVFPNPFNPCITLKFGVLSARQVTLVLFDVKGARVATMLQKQMKKGYHTVSWQAHGFNAGVYFARLKIGNKILTKKLLLLK